MAIEIEKKYRLTDDERERAAAKLNESNAEYAGEDFEENAIYGGGVLSVQDAALRVRKIAGKTVLTYKRRIQDDSAVKYQIEHETAVENAEEIENIIENLGFAKTLVYEKRRKTWKFRAAEIVLDELPFGSFMEIEGAPAAIAEAETLLDAGSFTVEDETYPHLTAKYGSSNGEVIEARFAK